MATTEEELRSEDHRLVEQLERVFVRKSFQEDVHVIRRKWRIPNEGFANFIDWKKWIKSKGRSDGFTIILDIDRFATKQCKDLKLSHNYYLWLVAYVYLGKQYFKFDPDIPFERSSYARGFDINPSFCCGLEFNSDEGCVNIKIFPGASYREVAKFVQTNMKLIEIFLEDQETKVAPIRRRPKVHDHELIYQHYLKGDLNNYGQYTRSNTDTPMPEIIKKYDVDYRRNIIQRQKKQHR